MRYLLLFLLVMFFLRAFWRLLEGFIEGVSRPPRRTRAPGRGVQMARDPVCGTFVVPERAVMLIDGSDQVFFCSDACRDKYRASPSRSSGRPDSAQGRTA